MEQGTARHICRLSRRARKVLVLQGQKKGHARGLRPKTENGSVWAATQGQIWANHYNDHHARH